MKKNKARNNARNNVFRILLFFLFCVFAAGIIVNSAYATDSTATDTSFNPVKTRSVTIVKNDRVTSTKYFISPGDILSISVYDEPSFAQPEIVVRPDGYATIDPIGEVYVEGLDIAAMTNLLEDKFKEYLNEPRISVNIKEFNPASVNIFGAVQKPGTYQQATGISKNYYADSKNPIVRTDLTLTNVISNAGGFSVDADLSNINVKGADGIEKKLNLWKFIKEGDTSQNIKLKSGDTIFVPKTDSITINDEDYKLLTRMSLYPVSFPVRVVGEVKTAGTFNITGESPYLNTAISSAAGYTLDANKTTVVVYRKAGNDKLARIYVDPFKQDFVLRPNDLVEVRKRTFMKFVYGADYINRLIMPFSNLGGGLNSWSNWINPHRVNYIP